MRPHREGRGVVRRRPAGGRPLPPASRRSAHNLLIYALYGLYLLREAPLVGRLVGRLHVDVDDVVIVEELQGLRAFAP